MYKESSKLQNKKTTHFYNGQKSREDTSPKQIQERQISTWRAASSHESWRKYKFQPAGHHYTPMRMPEGKRTATPCLGKAAERPRASRRARRSMRWYCRLGKSLASTTLSGRCTLICSREFKVYTRTFQSLLLCLFSSVCSFWVGDGWNRWSRERAHFSSWAPRNVQNGWITVWTPDANITLYVNYVKFK